MVEQMTNESQPVQAESQPTEVSGENTTQPVESTDVAAQAAPQSGESDTQDTQEQGIEGVDQKMPADADDREKAAIRKMHEATQEAARYRKEAEAFQQLLHHPEFNEFLQWQKQRKENPQGSQPPAQMPEVKLTEDEFLAAQADPAKFEGLLNSRLQSMLNPIAHQALQKINNLERELAVSKHEREIDAFATKHPDFWDIDQRIMKAAINETRGQGLDAAYKVAKQLEKQYLDKAQSSIQKKVAEKKQASSASPSRSVEPKVIEVESESEANRIAYEHALLGKRVDVRVKKNKNK
jgi:hypothetical protein